MFPPVAIRGSVFVGTFASPKDGKTKTSPSKAASMSILVYVE